MEYIVLIVVGLMALVIGLYLIICTFIGAVGLLEWAGKSGFIGVAAYFACWVFLFSLMLIGSIIIGALALWSE